MLSKPEKAEHLARRDSSARRLVTVMALLALYAPATGRQLDPLPSDRIPASDSVPSTRDDRSAEAKFTNLPLHFIANDGQLDARVAFYTLGSRNSVYFTPEGVTFTLTAPISSAGVDERETQWAVKLDFVGSNDQSVPTGQERTHAVVSYFRGERTEWKTGLPTYGGVAYRDLWPGIDLVYRGTASRLKYTFVVRPGADPDDIQLAYRGASEVRITEEGRLAVSTPVGEFEDDAPYAYQEIGDKRREVTSRYVLEPASTSEAFRYGFHVGDYDRSKPLILDPAVFYYSGFINGPGSDRGDGIAVDSAGNAYITGETAGGVGFPVAVGPYLSSGGLQDAFVAKINPTGTSLIYCGFIGGAANDAGKGIAVDGSGNAYIVGNTQSNEASFPLVAGPDATFNGADDVFVAKVDATGASLLYSGYIGGAGSDFGGGIAIDASGNAYVVGYTDSTEASVPPFPLVGSPDATFNGGTYDGFIAKVNDGGATLGYSGFYGGTGNDYIYGIAADGSGNVYVTGTTSSTEAGSPSFPLVSGPDLTYNGGSVDGFVAKLDPTATILYSGYIGGAASDWSRGIDIDGAGNAYIAGDTGSDETTFPETVGPDLTYNGGSADAFVCKLNPTASAYVYCGYIGGTSWATAFDVAVDFAGNAYVVGDTQTAGDWGFPTTNGPDDTENGGNDAYIAKVNAAGTALNYNGFIGGAVADYAYGVAVNNGDAYVVGRTNSSDFPVWVGPDLSYDAGWDAYVARIDTTPTAVVLVGFETGNGSELASLGGDSNIVSAPVRPGSGGYSLEQGPTPSELISGFAPALDALGLRFSFLKQADGSNRPLMEYRTGASVQWRLWLDQDPACPADPCIFRFEDVGGLGFPAVPRSSTPVTGSTWHTVRITYDSQAGGALRLMLDGSFEIDTTHTNAGTAIDAIRIFGLSSTYYFDDFFLNQSDAPPPFGQIVRVSPDGSGSLTQFDSEVPASSIHWQNVNEIPPDDANYNQRTASTLASDLYSLSASPSGTINAVKGMWRMRRGTSGSPGNPDYAWVIDGVSGSTTLVLADGSWVQQEVVWAAPPESAGPWTEAKVNAMELGATHNDTVGQDTYISWTAAMVDYDNGTTAVTLTSFNAVAGDGTVTLEWETGSEMNNLGFHLHRGLSEDGPFERVTPSVLAGLGSSPEGARYRYDDSSLTNGVTYYYKLEDIETTGARAFHGPVRATPEAGATLISSEDGHRSEMTYGAPAKNSLRVVERNSTSLVLELRTEGFYAESQDDGSVRIEIPGFELAEDALYAIPVKRTWVEAVAGRGVRLATVRRKGDERFTGLRPSLVAPPELEATPRGTVRAVRQKRAHRGSLSLSYPEKAAGVVSVGFQGDTKKALLELAPVRWDGSALVLSRELVIRLSFVGHEFSEYRLDGKRGRGYRRRDPDDRRVLARLVTTKRGLYGVRLDDISARAISGPLRLSRQGESVPFHIERSTLFFLSEGEEANPFAREAVYELEGGAEGDVMELVDATPGGRPLDHFWYREGQEENRFYQAALLSAPDVWLWDLLYAPAEKSYPFTVSGLSPLAEPSHLRVLLQGTSDFPADPDHHIRIRVNGQFAGEVRFNGKQPRAVEADVLPGVLREGENLLELENVGDTEAAYSMVMLDRYELTYPRRLEAEDGVLEGTFADSGMAEISGMGTGGYVLDVTEPSTRWLRVDGADRIRFRAEAGRTYLAVSRTSVRMPEVRRLPPNRLESPKNRADYVVIGPTSFLEAAEPLLALRRSQGLRVESVPVDAIYSEFGFGEPTPESVRDFLSYAYHEWESPSLRYVLLLGDGTYDYKDYLGTGVQNRVPPYLIKTRFLWTASDPAYAAVNGADVLPDLAIGRLPAANLEELQTMVEKIVTFETETNGLSGPVVLVTDDPDQAGDFDANADELASTILSPRTPRKIYTSRLGTAATRRAIVESFDQGASLVSYIGHGGIHLWADENLLNIQQVDALSSQAQRPLVLTMNCLNGYFHFPYFDSLAERLVKAEDKGAIAAFSPSGLSLNAPAHLYHKALLAEVFEGRHERLGDALVAAQASYAQMGAFTELLSIYHLIGDPALKLVR